MAQNGQNPVFSQLIPSRQGIAVIGYGRGHDEFSIQGMGSVISTTNQIRVKYATVIFHCRMSVADLKRVPYPGFFAHDA